jgi:hypothetical protein
LELIIIRITELSPYLRAQILQEGGMITHEEWFPDPPGLGMEPRVEQRQAQAKQQTGGAETRKISTHELSVFAPTQVTPEDFCYQQRTLSLAPSMLSRILRNIDLVYLASSHTGEKVLIRVFENTLYLSIGEKESMSLITMPRHKGIALLLSKELKRSTVAGRIRLLSSLILMSNPPSEVLSYQPDLTYAEFSEAIGWDYNEVMGRQWKL